jgi:hypothetical protein
VPGNGSMKKVDIIIKFVEENVCRWIKFFSEKKYWASFGAKLGL